METTAKNDISNEVLKYPTPLDADGFFYENQEEQDLEILTKTYDNGSASKMLTLSSGAKAVIRKLRGRDFIETKRRVQADNSLDFETVNMSMATKIDDQQHPPEYYLDDLYQADFSRLMAAYELLNFQ